jgi:predicted transcriptional regulator
MTKKELLSRISVDPNICFGKPCIRGQRMRVRDIRISIKTKEDLFNEIKEVWGRLEKGEQVKKHGGISFENIEAMRKMLSEERLRISKTIKKEHPKSIYGLAKLLNSDIKNTFDDVQFQTGRCRRGIHRL